jgi:hypothetical protein
VRAYVDERIELYTLDLTAYEAGMRCFAAEQRQARRRSLRSSYRSPRCPRVCRSNEHGFKSAAKLADEHRPTFHDAAYAAGGASPRRDPRGDGSRLPPAAGLGHRPSDIIQPIPT